MNGYIDKLLPVLKERDQLSTFLSVAAYCREVFKISYSDGEYLSKKLVQFNLATFLRPDGDMRITTFGREIEASGGWGTHVERIRLKRLLAAQDEKAAVLEAENEKLQAQFQREQDRLIDLHERLAKKEQDEYQLKLDEMNVKAAKRAANGTWFGVLVAIVAIVTPVVIQVMNSDAHEDQINELKVEVARLDSILKIQSKVHMQTRYPPDSLPRHK